MPAFRALLLIGWLILVSYTAVVIAAHGMNLLPVFFGDIGRAAWPGQFNLDFLCLLVLSATWTAWRNAFSVTGILLSLAALFGGAGFLLPYLLFLSFRTRGDLPTLLLGPSRTQAGLH